MGLQINQYPIERTELGADDYLDIDYWDGSQYRTAKIKGGAVGKNYLSFKFQNDLGFTIPKGTIVYLRTSSSSANYPHADLANSTTELTSSKTIGAVYDDVANGAIGLIVQVGEVDNLDTSAFNVGDRLWLSNIDGQVTTTIPQTPLHAVFIGIVTRSQNGNGRIVYNIQNGYELEELHNVTSDNYTTPQDEDSFLFLDETQEIWKRLTLDTLKSNLGGVTTNPTPGFYPICYNDFAGNPSIFADGGLTNSVIMTPMGYAYLGLTFRDNYSGLGKLLELNPSDYVYTFGQAEYQLFSGVSATGGLSIYPMMGEAVIGCGISSPDNGVFRASGIQGFITIGNTPSTSIGVDTLWPAMRIGANLQTFDSPSNPTTPIKWVLVTDESGNIFQMPLYQ